MAKSCRIFAEETVELAHVRTVLAATSNDAYNALVCMSIAPEVGQSKVFQLAMGRAMTTTRKPLRVAWRGNIAFDKDAVFESCGATMCAAGQFAKTRLTDSYSYSEFLGDQRSDALTVLVVSDGKVQFVSSQTGVEAQVGRHHCLFHAAQVAACAGRCQRCFKPPLRDAVFVDGLQASLSYWSPRRQWLMRR